MGKSRCSMSCVEVPLWLDGDIDRTGRAIRADVREAALVVWKSCHRNQPVQLDPCQAAELMEATVGQISRYLDRKAVAVFSREVEGLVAHSFHRAVQRELIKRNRFLSLDGSAKTSRTVADETWRQQIQLRVELQEIIKLLDDQSRTVLALRYAGYAWKEISQSMGVPVAT